MKIRNDEVLSVSTPADLLALVPYLLGFHPADSLLVVALADRRVVFMARGDLPAADTPATSRQALVDQLAGQTSRNGADSAMLIGYGPAETVTALVDAARDSFAAHQVELREILRVTDGRYHSYLCTDPACCPPEGVPVDTSTSPVAAAATVAGMVALPDRRALAAQIAPVTGAARQAMQQATAHADARLEELAGRGGDAVAELQRAGHAAVDEAFAQASKGIPLTDEQAAWLVLMLTLTPVRDHAWTRTDVDQAHLRLWADLTRRAPIPLAAAPAALCAFAAWRCGNGALANLAVGRALEADPGNRMAQLIAETLHLAVPPHALDSWAEPTSGNPAAPDGSQPLDPGTPA